LFSSDPAGRFVGIFVGVMLVSGEQTLTATFAIPNKGIEQMARKNGGACANPKQIRTDVDRRAAQPRFDNGAWSSAKISDVTGGGLYLFVTPDKSRPGNAASKLWRMGYRFHSRQKTYSIGPYGNGKDDTFSLANARRSHRHSLSRRRREVFHRRQGNEVAADDLDVGRMQLQQINGLTFDGPAIGVVFVLVINGLELAGHGDVFDERRGQEIRVWRKPEKPFAALFAGQARIEGGVVQKENGVIGIAPVELANSVDESERHCRTDARCDVPNALIGHLTKGHFGALD
jgi:hypothetical protein